MQPNVSEYCTALIFSDNIWPLQQHTNQWWFKETILKLSDVTPSDLVEKQI